MLSGLHRRFVWAAGSLAGLIILFGVLVALLPTITKWYAISWLEEQGVSASIENVSFKIFDGQVSIKAFQAVGPEKHKINLGELFIQVHLRDLADNKITIEKIEFSDFYVDIYQQLGRPIKVGGILFGKSAGAETKTTDARSESAAWDIVLNDIDFKNLKTCVQLHSQQGERMYDDCLMLDSFAWDGQGSYLPATTVKNEAGKLGARLTFELKNLRLHDNTDDSDIVSIGKLHIENMAVDGVNDINIDAVRLDNYAVLQRAQAGSKKNTHVADAKQIVLNKIGIRNLNDVVISSVDIEGLHSYLFRQENGNFEPIEKINQLLFPEVAVDTPQLAQNPESTESQIKPVFRIDKLTIAGDSAVTTMDAGIKPHFSGVARDIKVRVTEIDSSKPAHLSPLEFSFVVGEFGKVSFAGEIALFSKRPTGKLKGKLKAVNVADFSAYLNGALQHRIKSGNVDTDIDLVVQQGELNSTFNFVFHKFYVEPLSERESREHQEKLGMPLSTALSLLREKDDSIRLKLPVTGDMENPQFSLNDILQKVMADAIRDTIINYYTPFGLVAAAKATFNLATALRFDPVVFESTKTAMTDDGKRQLEKLATLLNERPNIRLLVCGYATLDDRLELFPLDEALTKKMQDAESGDEEAALDLNVLLPELTNHERMKMHDMARQRGESVRDHLMKDKKIDPARIILCNPKFTNDQDKPRVTLSL